MKQLGLHIVRFYIRLGLFFYYKKIKVVNIENVPKSGAVLFLANHHNALLDALLIATKTPRFSYFLTRASVFQNVIFSKILKSLLMLPVYRIRDGWQNLSKNNAIFNKCAKLLLEANAIAVFPEASHNIKRTVRPLSKGFTRIIFDVLERVPDTKMYLVPVGLNFLKAENFGDSVSLYFGKPIIPTSKAIINKTKSSIDLRYRVFKSLCQLTTHIPTETYDTTLQQLNNLKVDFLNPQAVNACISNEFKNCKPSQVKDFSAIKKVFKLGLILLLLVPYLIWKRAIQPKIKEVEFTGTFRFAVGISLVPIYILTITILLLVMVNITWALAYVLGTIALTLLAVKL